MYKRVLLLHKKLGIPSLFVLFSIGTTNILVEDIGYESTSSFVDK
jgi:hypothetical protein